MAARIAEGRCLALARCSGAGLPGRTQQERLVLTWWSHSGRCAPSLRPTLACLDLFPQMFAPRAQSGLSSPLAPAGPWGVHSELARPEHVPMRAVLSADPAPRGPHAQPSGVYPACFHSAASLQSYCVAQSQVLSEADRSCS